MKIIRLITSPILAILVLVSLMGAGWLAWISRSEPALDMAARALIIEPALQECFYNAQLLGIEIEKNNKEAYEILDEREEADPFSKTTYKVVTRGKKLREPYPDCEAIVKSGKIREFMRRFDEFDFSEKNRRTWDALLAEMTELKVFGGENGQKRVYFEECARAKRLYEELQNFFAAAKIYEYNFQF